MKLFDLYGVRNRNRQERLLAGSLEAASTTLTTSTNIGPSRGLELQDSADQNLNIRVLAHSARSILDLESYINLNIASAYRSPSERLDKNLLFIAVMPAYSSLSGVIGRSLMRRPVAWNTAFAMAAGMPTIPNSPMPLTPSGLTTVSFSSMNIVSIS